MARKGFYFDATRCVNCKTCAVACHKKNNLPDGVYFRKVSGYQTGEYPNARAYFWSHACNHCANPACTRACPTGAMYKDENDGTVQHNDDICIGCGSCAIACPFDAPLVIHEIGIAKKCNACIDTRGVDGVPTCVAACGMRALDFGEYDELVARHPESADRIAPMPDLSLTDPTFKVKARDYMQDGEYADLVQ